MSRNQDLPEDLTAEQVIALQDALLSNADRLLNAALTMLEGDDVALARSLAILGMEESGKAIALHERRRNIVYDPEGEPFVNGRLKDLWGQHRLKLDQVYDFLVNEKYWFGVETPDPEENAAVLGSIQAWRTDHNTFKQRGFYVDVLSDGTAIAPWDVEDTETVRAVIGHVHQIGWQLRLGEHIEAKSLEDATLGVPPATDEEIEEFKAMLERIQPKLPTDVDTRTNSLDEMIEMMHEGVESSEVHNVQYAFRLSSEPFENVGKRGYEAEDRQLRLLAQDSDPVSQGMKEPDAEEGE